MTYCLSAHGGETLKADTRAFVAFMAHLKKIDEAHRTVIMVQVQNEVGTFNNARDYSPKAEAAFRQPVPQAVLAKKKSPVPGAASGTWSEVYGPYADEYFLAYSMADYIGKMAKAGRAVYNLPVFVNAAVRDAVAPATPWKKNFNAGGPTWDVIDIYQAAAPAIDISAADLYGKELDSIMERNWNGDQVDTGLNLPARPTVLKVRMGTY